MKLIQTALDSYAKIIDMAHSDRMSTVGASEIGQCKRKIFWIKNESDGRLGVDRDPEYRDNWGARKRGTVFEDHFWVPAMRLRFGTRLKFAGKSQRTFVHDYLSATPDGMIVNLTKAEKDEIGTDANCVMVECKTADPRTNLTAPKQEHVYQTQVQMGIVRQTTDYRPTHSILSYTDASFWSEGKEFVIEYDDDIYTAALHRATEIMTDTDLERMPPEGWIAGGNECRYCPFTKPCGIERRNLPFENGDVELDKQFIAEITDLARELKAAEFNTQVHEDQVRALQNDIKDRLRAKGVRKIPGVLTWSEVKGRESWDNKSIREAAAAAGVDIDQYNTVGEKTDRLVISIGP
jgi:CRISPR/Cas system-associated exonuclease Cas4 (RecB family)